MTDSRSTGQIPSDLLDAVRKSQDMMVDATKRLVDALQSIRPSISTPDLPHSDKLPKPEELVDNLYNFTEELLASQRNFAENMIEATKPLRGGKEGPAAKEGHTK